MFKRYQKVTHHIVDMVNGPRAIKGRLRDGLAPRFLREQLIQIAHSAAHHQLVAGTLAEASLRLVGGKMLITARGRWFGQLQDDDLAIATLDGSAFLDDDRLPLQTEWHRQIYNETSAKALLFLQPLALMTLSQRNLAPQVALLPMAPDVVGTVLIADRLLPASERPADCQSILIKNYGLLIWSNDLASVFPKAQLLTFWASLTKSAYDLNDTYATS